MLVPRLILIDPLVGSPNHPHPGDRCQILAKAVVVLDRALVVELADGPLAPAVPSVHYFRSPLG